MEWREFKRQLEREVSTSWFLQLSQGNKVWRLNGVRNFTIILVKGVIRVLSKKNVCIIIGPESKTEWLRFGVKII